MGVIDNNRCMGCSRDVERLFRPQSQLKSGTRMRSFSEPEEPKKATCMTSFSDRIMRRGDWEVVINLTARDVFA